VIPDVIGGILKMGLFKGLVYRAFLFRAARKNATFTNLDIFCIVFFL